MDTFQDDNVGPVEWEVVDTAEDRLHALRQLFAEHDYVQVVRGCDQLLQQDSCNNSAKKLKWMAKKKLVNHEMKMGVAVVSMALLTVVGSMSFMNKRILGELLVKDVQVSSLIDEVGELKEENLVLYRKLENNFQDIKEVTNSVGNLEKILPEGALSLQNKLEAAQAKVASQSIAVEKLVSAGMDHATQPLLAKDDTFDVLILGTHGSLTDTIMLASINPVRKTVSLFSIPRDLTVNGRRINEYYYRFGVDALREKIEEITGLYPEKYVVLDLKAFEVIVDHLGGLDVKVEKALYDSMYPGPNFTYQAFSVEVGEHHFDGRTALMYARSRKSTNDFNRAERQQQIVEAVRDKIKSLNLLENADALVGMYSEVMDALETDVDLIDFVAYVKRTRDYEIERGNVLTSGNYLYSTQGTNGAYLLVPKDGTYKEIRDYVATVVRE